ncbi:MAG: DUF1127 domain-containing protein, partial [Geminicoccales bacterium]
MTARTVTSTHYHRSPTLPHAEPAAALLALRAMADRIRWAIWRWYQVRRTSRQVAQLQDHILHDIGLSRMSIQSATLRRVHEEEEFR